MENFEGFILIIVFVQVKGFFLSPNSKILSTEKTLIRHYIFNGIVEFVLIRNMSFAMNHLAFSHILGHNEKP